MQYFTYFKILIFYIVERTKQALLMFRMEVMPMKNKQFDFKDLMAFGSFLLALLTFIFMNAK